MENTAMTKAERFMQKMMVSMAIQEAINQKAIYLTPEQQAALDTVIVQLANSLDAAEA